MSGIFSTRSMKIASHTIRPVYAAASQAGTPPGKSRSTGCSGRVARDLGQGQIARSRSLDIDFTDGGYGSVLPTEGGDACETHPHRAGSALARGGSRGAAGRLRATHVGGVPRRSELPLGR